MIPSANHVVIRLDGELCACVINLDLRWSITSADDLRVRGTITKYKLRNPRVAGQPHVEVPLVKQVVPVFVEHYSVNDHDGLQVLHVSLITNGPITEIKEEP